MDKKNYKICDTETEKTQLSPTQKPYFDKQCRY